MDRFENLRAKVLSETDFVRALSDEEVRGIIDRVILEEGRGIPLKERTGYAQKLFHSLRGLDILEELLADPEITEIMVNGPGEVFVEKNGHLFPEKTGFSSEERMMDVIRKIVSGVNRSVNTSTPIVDARLPNGARVNVVLPPVAVDGPVLTIRKFPEEPMTMEDMLRLETLTEEAAGFLAGAVTGRCNLFISGGTGSGKTTFLNALTGFIPCEERIVTIEDSAELRLQGLSNLVRLEVRNPSLDGAGAISIRDLIRTALRMRPDRIIVGEVRGAECLDMLQAMNTGHEGSFSTGHANSPGDMMTRLEVMTLMAAEIPLGAIRSQIASALDVLIHLGRMKDGSRKVLSIEEVTGYEEGEIRRQAIFAFEGGRLVRTEHEFRGRRR